MPMYEYQCKDGHVTVEYRTVDLRSKPASCKVCGNEAEKRILSAPKVFGDFNGYISPASGNWVEGRRARNEDLLRTGCIPYEAGARADAARTQKTIQEKQEAIIDDAIERTATALDIRRD